MLRQMAMLRNSRMAAHLVRTSDDLIATAIGASSLLSSPPLKISSRHFIDLHKMGNKDAIEKEKARLSDELSRGYFADISEIRKNGGKIAMANKTLIPSLEAINFPNVEVNLSDGSNLMLPIINGRRASDCSEKLGPLAALLCLSFRASSQPMAESWTVPFVNAFHASTRIRAYEVSFIDSWLLSRGLVRKMLLKMMKKSTNPRREIVYSFGDHYDLRKKLHILNLLTGYIFLLDRFGRIRWQGFGLATEEEVSSLLSCASVLLEAKVD